MPGNIGKRGKCEYTYVFVNNVILLLIELKFNLTMYNMSEWSDIVAPSLLRGRWYPLFILLPSNFRSGPSSYTSNFSQTHYGPSRRMIPS
jgi:hypothetical protein